MYEQRNRVRLVGEVYGKPIISNDVFGSKRAVFSIVTHECFRAFDGVKTDATLRHEVFAWGKLAVMAEKHLHDRMEIAIEGRYIPFILESESCKGHPLILVKEIHLLKSVSVSKPIKHDTWDYDNLCDEWRG